MTTSRQAPEIINNPYGYSNKGQQTTAKPVQRTITGEIITNKHNPAYNPGYTGNDGAGPIHRSVTDSTGAVSTPNINNKSKSKPNPKGDWRVRLSLAPAADYFYNAANPGILAPLAETNGVIFPYTPSIDTIYEASYEEQQLTHSNYNGYFYKGSKPGIIAMTGTFTANSTEEANYLLAVIHFFKSVTKMFYGQDANRGLPPPVCFLNGMGAYQFNNHPVLVSQYMFKLPDDVDYIRAGNVSSGDTTVAKQRQRPERFNYTSWSRLESSGLFKGAINQLQTQPISSYSVDEPTYVPTRVDITLQMHPMQSREQMSNEFSLREFANGSLTKKGFF